MPQPTIFISYCQKDEEEKDQLLSHLGVLQHAGLIEIWSDGDIKAGADKEQTVNHAIDRARAAVLLISANFLTSSVLETEIPRLLKRRKGEDLIVFPVLAKACAWHRVPWLAGLSVRPKHGKPIWRDNGTYADEDLATIADEIADVIDSEPPTTYPFVVPKRHPSLIDFRRWLQGE